MGRFIRPIFFAASGESLKRVARQALRWCPDGSPVADAQSPKAFAAAASVFEATEAFTF